MKHSPEYIFTLIVYGNVSFSDGFQIVCYVAHTVEFRIHILGVDRCPSLWPSGIGSRLGRNRL